MPDVATTLPLYSARPTIRVDGEGDEQLTAGLLQMTVHESDDGAYRCELVFGNWGANSDSVGYIYFPLDLFDFGKTITIEVGDGDAEAQVFEGKITAVEGRYGQQRAPEIQILAEDRLQDLRMVRRSRAFEDVTLDDVAQTIAGEQGLQTDIDIDSPNYAVLAQLNQSDLAFLRERARGIDAEVWVDGGTLHMQSRSRRETGTLSLTYRQRLHEFSVIADLAHQRTHVAVAGWDVTAKEGLKHEADNSAIQSELDGGTSGAQALQSGFGERRDSIVHLTPATNDETQTLAKTYFRKMARRFVTGRGVAEGDGRLRAGANVDLEGLGDLFNGTYYVSKVTHMFTADGGYQTSFCVERPGLGTQ